MEAPENREEVSGLESFEGLSTEIYELKRKIGELEKNMDSLSDALKKTLTDIRSVISELDNPFNILRSVGVDELLEKCIEHVREEVNKIKREEMKRSMVKSEENSPQNRPPVACGEMEIKIVKEGDGGVEDGSRQESALQPDVAQLQQPEKSACQILKKLVGEPERREEVKPGKDKPIVAELEKLDVDALKEPSISRRDFKETFSMYKTAYLMLAVGYLILKVGSRGAELVITEYVKRGWITPSTARELEDIIQILGLDVEEEPVNGGGIDVEDHILLIDYLRRVEELSASKANSADILFMLFLSKSISYMLRSLARKEGVTESVF